MNDRGEIATLFMCFDVLLLHVLLLIVGEGGNSQRPISVGTVSPTPMPVNTMPRMAAAAARTAGGRSARMVDGLTVLGLNPLLLLIRPELEAVVWSRRHRQQFQFFPCHATSKPPKTFCFQGLFVFNSVGVGSFEPQREPLTQRHPYLFTISITRTTPQP
jgi:hypothetical protein